MIAFGVTYEPQIKWLTFLIWSKKGFNSVESKLIPRWNDEPTSKYCILGILKLLIAYKWCSWKLSRVNFFKL